MPQYGLVTNAIGDLANRVRGLRQDELAHQRQMQSLDLANARLGLEAQTLAGNREIQMAKFKREQYLDEPTPLSEVIRTLKFPDENKAALMKQFEPILNVPTTRRKFGETLFKYLQNQQEMSLKQATLLSGIEQKHLDREAKLEAARIRAQGGDGRGTGDLNKFEQVTGMDSSLRGTPEYQKAFMDFQQDLASQKTKIYDEEAQKIGDAIMAGKQPPKISGFGMSKITPQIKAYLADKGFNLSRAELDWKATEKHITQLNGAQQLRLRQAVMFTKDSLDIIERLAKQWGGGRFPILNKANLAAAVNGAYGVDAQSIATQLKTQIADLTSELGTVYKGGNSSTDESLRLAAENLNANWSYEQLIRNVDLVRENLKYRENSLVQVGVAGVPGGARYMEFKKIAQDSPPVEGARKAPDGNWYIEKNGQYYKVVE